jgi:predicted lipid-binding transport protein (Tim44 family)
MRLRLHHALLLVPLLTAPLLTTQSQAQPSSASASSAATAPVSTAQHHGRQSAAQHFAEANTTNDGKLTLDQARSGYKSIAKSFAEIDMNHHGYVTMDDIKAWRAAKKAARQAAKAHLTTG